MQASDIAASGPAAFSKPRLEAASPRYGEKAIYYLLAACAADLGRHDDRDRGLAAVPGDRVLRRGLPGDFFFGTDWGPTFEPPTFGVLPIVVGTLSVTFWSLLFAIPIGLGAAIYLSEYASRRVRKTVKPILEVLAGVPTVAFGFFALVVLTPALQDDLARLPRRRARHLQRPRRRRRDRPADRADHRLGLRGRDERGPHGLREGAYAIGATKAKVATKVVFPAALSGIVASIILAASRAIGETMVVLLAVGNTPNLTFNPLEPIQAMTAFIATTATGDIATGTITYKTVFAVALLLFAMTLVMNLLSIRLVRKYREVYE